MNEKLIKYEEKMEKINCAKAHKHWAFTKNAKKVQDLFKIVLLKSYKNVIITMSKS